MEAGGQVGNGIAVCVPDGLPEPVPGAVARAQTMPVSCVEPACVTWPTWGPGSHVGKRLEATCPTEPRAGGSVGDRYPQAQLRPLGLRDQF